MVSYTILPACLPVCLTPVVQSPDRVMRSERGGGGGKRRKQVAHAVFVAPWRTAGSRG